MTVDLPELLVADPAAWAGWLTEHADGAPGVWLVLAKGPRTDGPTRLRYDAALLEALCHGWIDGQVGRRDDVTYRQRFTPRRARSGWSARNVALATDLAAAGRLQPRGLAEFRAAQADGRAAAAYAGQATLEVPDDLAAALAADPVAAAAFAALSRGDRYSLLHPLVTLRTAAGRARRVARTVDELAGRSVAAPPAAARRELSPEPRQPRRRAEPPDG